MDQLSRTEDLEQKRIYWKQRIEHWQQTGISQAEYCRRHNLKDHQFGYWKRRLLKIESEVAFVPLQLDDLPHTPVQSDNPSLFVTIDNRFKVEVRPGFDGQHLRQLISVLRGLA